METLRLLREYFEARRVPEHSVLRSGKKSARAVLRLWSQILRAVTLRDHPPSRVYDLRGPKNVGRSHKGASILVAAAKIRSHKGALYHFL